MSRRLLNLAERGGSTHCSSIYRSNSAGDEDPNRCHGGDTEMAPPSSRSFLSLPWPPPSQRFGSEWSSGSWGDLRRLGFAQRRQQRGELAMAFDPAAARRGPPERQPHPPRDHRAVAPACGVAGDVADGPDQLLDAVGGRKEPAQPWRQAQRQHREGAKQADPASGSGHGQVGQHQGSLRVDRSSQGSPRVEARRAREVLG